MHCICQLPKYMLTHRATSTYFCMHVQFYTDALTHIHSSSHALPPLIGNRTLHQRVEGLCICHSFHLSLSPPLPPFADHIDRDKDKEVVHVHMFVQRCTPHCSHQCLIQKDCINPLSCYSIPCALIRHMELTLCVEHESICLKIHLMLVDACVVERLNSCY